MGCDIHAYIEEYKDGQWKPRWQPLPDPTYWWDDIVGQKLEDGTGKLAFLETPDDQLYTVLSDYYRSIPMSEVEQTFGSTHYISRVWFEHVTPRAYEGIRTGQSTSRWIPGDKGREFSQRDYEWFGLFGVRGRAIPVLKFSDQIPTDVSRLVREEYERTEQDNHGLGCINVADLLQQFSKIDYTRLYPDSWKVGRCQQIEWLEEHIEDPKNTRFIFWFDN